MKTQTAYRFFGGSAGNRTQVYCEGEPLPEGYYTTPEEAKLQWEQATSARMADRNACRPEVDAKAKAIRAALGECKSEAELNECKSKLALAHGALIKITLLPARLEIYITAQGKLGAHDFYYIY